ncbi:protein-tyrosine phosphatase-like protein [Irpex rosettiformis]|uniref:Protein-tyrosine phosphatase-like protein n=1 Tax=Irpex rosettiformis TaxID=378272 RepID=A0ACB8UHP2_9APHY|nr:protein-tyrosine phosphatase-like protein [Irpex rosettiformis]
MRNAASLILPRLYLSSYTTATNAAELEAIGITHIISVMDFTPKPCPPHIKRLHVKLEDTFSADILRHLEGTTEFIRYALQENESNKVLVHCIMGISRSTTVVCAYLIASNRMTAQDALEFVVKQRSIASPNSGFRAQLEIYATQCRSQDETMGDISAAEAQLMKVVVDDMKSQDGVGTTTVKRG